MTLRSRHRRPAVVIALLALLVVAGPASASPQKIVPVGPDPAWGCVQSSSPSLTVRTPRGALIAPGFRQAGGRLSGQVRNLSRRLQTASGARRRRLQAQRRRLAATLTGVRSCRAGSLPAPARSRRSFAFVCLHGFLLPAVVIDGSCAVDLRPRGIPSGRARAAAYDIGATYDTLDVVLHAECTQDDGALEGPDRMEDVYGLYLVRCGSGNSEEPLPAGQAWGVLRMDVENCDEILAADENGCGPSDPKPESDPTPSPRTPPSSPQPDCIILGMEMENPDC